jgi:GNAT superfamily N-acetyltransferase
MAFWLTPDDAAAFEHLTTPSLAQALSAVASPLPQKPWPAPGALLAIGSFFAGQPAALAMLRAGSDRSLEVLSLVVAEPFRRLGLASEQLRWLREQALELGWRSLSISYPLNHGSTAAMERLTTPQRGWQQADGLRLVHLDRDGGQALIQRMAPVVSRLQQSDRFTLLPWFAMASDQQQRIGERLQAPQWAWPLHQNLDAAYARLDGAISTVLLDRGTPAGWLMVHRVGPDLFRVTQWWVIDDLHGMGTGLMLLVHVVREALAAWPRYKAGCFGVAPENLTMLRLSSRQIEPLACNVQGNRRCTWLVDAGVASSAMTGAPCSAAVLSRA